MNIGQNPAREDGAWESPEDALIAFATHFGKFCSDLKGKTLYVRTPPTLDMIVPFDSDVPLYRVIGRFEVME